MKNKVNNSYYKNKYYIVFYDESDEYFIAMFNNVKQICLYKNKELNTVNTNLTNVELYRALKRKDNSTRMLDGTLMHVHLIDVEDIDEN